MKHELTIDHNPGVIHVLYRHYISGSKSDVLGYFTNPIHGSLAFEHEVKNCSPVRQIRIELKPEYGIVSIYPIMSL